MIHDTPTRQEAAEDERDLAPITGHGQRRTLSPNYDCRCGHRETDHRFGHGIGGSWEFCGEDDCECRCFQLDLRQYAGETPTQLREVHWLLPLIAGPNIPAEAYSIHA